MPKGFASLAALNYLERSDRARLVRSRTSGVTRSMWGKRPDIPIRQDLRGVAAEAEAERKRTFAAQEAEKQREFAQQQAQQAQDARSEESEREYERKTASETAKAEVAQRFAATETGKALDARATEGKAERASAEKRTLAPLRARESAEELKRKDVADKAEARYSAYLDIFTEGQDPLLHGPESFARSQQRARTLADSGMEPREYIAQQAKARASEASARTKESAGERKSLLGIFGNKNVAREQRAAAGERLGLRLAAPEKTLLEKADEKELIKDITAWDRGEFKPQEATTQRSPEEIRAIGSMSEEELKAEVGKALRQGDRESARVLYDALHKRGQFKTQYLKSIWNAFSRLS